jgi:hypothetical protein
MLLSATLALFAGTRIKSTSEVAATAATLEPSPILAPVVKIEISTSIITRGFGHYTNPFPVTLSVTDAGLIVTVAPVEGEVLAEGTVALEVSGRPVLALVGERPAYRNLEVGGEGPDVRQLQLSLRRLGYQLDNIEGVFEESTEAAVAALYVDAGYQPELARQPTASEESELRSHWSDLRSAEGDNSAESEVRQLLAEQYSRIGLVLPASEILFFPSMPVRVGSVVAGRGAAALGEMLEVSDLGLVVDSSIPLADYSLVGEGHEVTIERPELGLSMSGSVTFKASEPGTHGVPVQEVYIQIQPNGADADVVGTSLRVVIPIETSDGPVLAVPVAALLLGPDGYPQVEVHSATKESRFVRVTAGLSSEGLVEVDADGELREGDWVVVGSQ